MSERSEPRSTAMPAERSGARMLIVATDVIGADR